MNQHHSPAGSPADGGIAIIGMAGRFPGASDIPSFWRNISTGVESFTRFTDEELLEAGVSPAVFQQPNYVRARPVLDDVRGFDAGFFGYNPREAALADPQQRIFLECVWEVLESAGYAAPEGRGSVGVFAGMNISGYLLTRLMAFEMGIDTSALMIGNDKDSLATNVSFRLDLNGPSLSVQTFCSTSLVAVHLASESLRRGECDMAVAGGVSVRIPDRVGYLWEEGGQESPDGHVRTFDAEGRGSMFGDGAAVVVLKRLADAVADRDTVHAVIRASAINNDGAVKFSYLAPSIDGQRRCVSAALARAGVDPADISYVEAHGTATEVGDPMEVAALTRAFGPTARKQYCVLGSIKPNVGHLDRASGATGLIKVVQSLRNELIPGTLHYRSPNPEIDFAASPFRVTAEPTPWPRDPDRPRVAGISSLGMGGTNAHAIVTEAPLPERRGARTRRWQILPVSARTQAAAERSCARLAEHLTDTADDLGDIAYTLQAGRRVFGHRKVVVADTAQAAAARLADPAGPLGRADATVGRKTGFLIAGVGEQYPGMVAALYAEEPGFRADVDECLAVLGLTEPAQLSEIFVPAAPQAEDTAGDLARLLGRAGPGSPRPAGEAHLVQPAVFVAEYALARRLIRWGIEPDVMIGYSLGEYVAACLAGVLSLPDALRLVAYRAKLIASRPEGAMLAVSADERRLRALLGELFERELDVAVRTGSQVVLAGPEDAVEAAAALLLTARIGHRRLETTHAFHSRMLKPVAGELTAWIADNVTLSPPEIPYLSNVTGEPATAEVVTDPAYWARHMCETVEFGAGLGHLLGQADLALAEIGPGQSLGALTRGHPACDRAQWPLIVTTLPAANDPQDAGAALATAVARLWLTGVPVDWAALHGDEPAGDVAWRPGRVPLPTYPFEHQDYWLDIDQSAARGGAPAFDESDPTSIAKAYPRLPDTRWIHTPVWKQTTLRPPREEEAGRWLVYTDDGPAGELAAPLLAYLEGRDVVLVRPGERFSSGPDGLRVRPGSPEDALAALRDLAGRGWEPERVVHLWPATDAPVEESLQRGLHTLVALARAAGDLGLGGWTLDIVTSRGQRVLPGDRVRPALGTLLGPTRLIPVEYPRVRTRLVDVDDASGDALLAELRAEPADQLVGLRGGRRWIPDHEVLDAAVIEAGPPAAEVRRGGVYLVTGGLGGIGLAMAERLAEQFRARLVLLGRTPVPPREEWDAILASDSAVPEVRRRLEGLRRLEAAGAEVVTVAGDVSRPEDARRAVDAAIERFGELNGVLHCAGVPAVGLMQFKTVADMERVLAPKVMGTLALAAALREALPDRPADFLALYSSTTSATGGGAGQVDYCAANAFLDAFALGEDLPGTAIVSVGWCEWTWNGWTEGLENYDEGSKQYFAWYRENFGLTFDQGWQTLLRALASGERHVVASTQDFAPLVAMSRRSSIESHQATVKKLRDAFGRHPRPDLSTAYVEPQSETEETIAAVWSEALGLEQVGVHDNFFELGGNSLLGMEIIADVRRALGLSYLPPHILYQAPTIASLAEAARADQDAGEQPSQDRDQQRSRIAQRRNMLKSGRTS
ncbi:Phthiocerol synthesis polyketide synthase type I PpsE [Nonomuraea coxensis DSM 45129]|uniref:Phthiocerol synthesis polyketide synthase type I PpsE n=1 Tax=Nonomuraea coxensis DSM 45129 TaxID=1122611 RepID=A0ABX8U4K6_9ACTN|nr:type I polyketide synthase [Nonomuraea coxensis]QYC42677.1 Phthiocerol synthesis polyketide synthase type I PpsE [Nonomuraea coxensis DSM 45129]